MGLLFRADTRESPAKMTISPPLVQALERIRARFGLELDLVDAECRPVSAEMPTELARLVRGSPFASRLVQQAIREGLDATVVEESGLKIHVHPFRSSASRDQAQCGAIVARFDPALAGADVRGCVDLAFAAIEADLAAAAAFRDERQRSRRLLAILRFLLYVMDAPDEADLSEALVQAIAVWFDLDARVYARDAAGDYVLHRWLPAARLEDGATRLDARAVDVLRRGGRAVVLDEVRSALEGPRMLLVPLTAEEPPASVLSIAGELPPDAAAELEVVGRVVGTHLELRALRGNARTVPQVSGGIDAHAAPANGFEHRIHEEVERAKRFDLRLSLILLDVSAPVEDLARLKDTLRREVRGSDLLGTVGGRQLAALLTHTDEGGLQFAVQRLRRRVVDAARLLSISSITLGQAAFSPDCRTVDALLAQAARHAEPVSVH